MRAKAGNSSILGLRLLVCLLVLLVMAAGCAGDDDDGTVGDDDDQAGVDDPGDEPPPADTTTVTIGIESDISSIDPLYTSGLLNRWVMENAFAALVTREGDDPTELPYLAVDWEMVDETALLWTMELRDDVTFHNGEHMTAEDVRFTIMDRILHPDHTGSLSQHWSAVEDVVVIDDYNIEFHLHEPDPFLHLRMERAPIGPKSFFEEVGPDEYVDDSVPIVGSGPYEFVEWRRDDRIVFEAFDDYFEGRPSIDNVIFRVIPDDAARVAALQTGEIDIAFGLSPDQAEQLAGMDAIDVRGAMSHERSRIQLDQRREPFDDVRIRQAANYAVDMQEIVDALLDGEANVLPAALVPEEAGYNHDLEPYPYDPDQARELLADAGYPDGLCEAFPDLEFSLNRRIPKVEEIGEAVAHYLEEAGLCVNLRAYDTSDFNDRKHQKHDNIEALGELMFDEHAGANLFHGYNHYTGVIHCDGSPTHSGYYCNPDVDAMFQQGIDTWASDPETALGYMQEAERMLHEDASSIFAFQRPRLYGVNANLEWQPDASGAMLMSQARWTE